MRIQFWLSALFLSLPLLFISPNESRPQTANSPIILGQSCALSGPAKDLGLEMRAGLLAALAFISPSKVRTRI